MLAAFFAAPHPGVYFVTSEFPQATGFVRRQILALNPFVYGVGLDTEIGGDFFYR